MRTLLRIASVFCLLLGLFLLWVTFGAHLGVSGVIMGILAVIFGVRGFHYSKPENYGKKKPAAPAAAPIDDSCELSYSFYVAGISYRQKDICELCFENDDYLMSKHDLIEYGMADEIIYKYDSSFGPVSLVPDPNNEHDKNAIKVMRRDILLGYVPKDSASKVRSIISGDYEASASAYAGPYKILHEEYDGSYSVERENQNVGLKVLITYK